MNGCTPNKKNKKRHDLIREKGCVVCYYESGEITYPQIHHITGCETQDDHVNTIGLCYWHHMADQQLPPNPSYISRHPNKKRFEDKYGTEQELLELQNEMIGADNV